MVIVGSMRLFLAQKFAAVIEGNKIALVIII